jgi:FkbM family methyltransferase
MNSERLHLMARHAAEAALRLIKAHECLSFRDSVKLERVRRSRKSAKKVAEFRLSGYGPVHLRSNSSDAETFEQIFLNREYAIERSSLPHADLMQQIMSPRPDGRHPLILDCGANIGLSCLFFATRFPHARVIGIEPSSGNVAMARANTAGLGNVEIVHAAVDMFDGCLELETEGREDWAFRTREASGVASGSAVEKVTAFSLPTLLNRVSDVGAVVVKIDVEGAEHRIFSDNLDWLDRVDVLIIELHDFMLPRQSNSLPVMRALASHDHDLVISGENLFVFFHRADQVTMLESSGARVAA